MISCLCLVQETGIDMNYIELYKLIQSLDKNNDGEINYRLVTDDSWLADCPALTIKSSFFAVCILHSNIIW